MLEKILGFSDKSILKKRNYYIYLVGSIMGLVAIVIGLAGLIFKYSNRYKDMVLFQNDNVEYLKSLSQNIKDPKLQSVSDLFELNFNTIMGLYTSFLILIIAVGILFVSHFVLYKKLRSKIIHENSHD